jgi:hypothetical protein
MLTPHAADGRCRPAACGARGAGPPGAAAAAAPDAGVRATMLGGRFFWNCS